MLFLYETAAADQNRRYSAMIGNERMAREIGSKPEVVTVERLEAAIMVVARSIADTGEVTHVPLLERLESELAKMKSARDGVSRARQIVGEKVLERERKRDLLQSL
jgi:hypothetical protein